MSLNMGSTQLIKMPHGCGDREVLLDERMGMFDLTLFPGERHQRRLVEAGSVDRRHSAIAGYPKFEMVRSLGRRETPLFNNDRPTVVYIPHFKQDLASWERWGKQILEYFAQSETYNLILAPHVRLFADGKISYEELEPFMHYDHIHVDLHSEWCIDMSYTAAADIYMGDVSSQVYEFVTQPRPCVFLNAHQVAWRDDPSYDFLHMGPVVDSLEGLDDALTAAQRDHEAVFKPRQETCLHDIFSVTDTAASTRAANAVRAQVSLPAAQAGRAESPRPDAARPADVQGGLTPAQ